MYLYITQNAVEKQDEEGSKSLLGSLKVCHKPQTLLGRSDCLDLSSVDHVHH